MFKQIKQKAVRAAIRMQASLMELQQAISYEKGEEMVGRVLEVMVEGKVADEDVYITRTYRDAPGVDGYLFLNSGATFMTGDFVKAVVTEFSEYDLKGELWENESAQ